MNTLEERRKISQIMFIVSLIYDKISSPPLLGELNIRVPIRSIRNNKQLLLSENNLNEKNPFHIMKKLFNSKFDLIDFDQSIEVIKKNLKESFSIVIQQI